MTVAAPPPQQSARDLRWIAIARHGRHRLLRAVALVVATAASVAAWFWILSLFSDDESFAHQTRDAYLPPALTLALLLVTLLVTASLLGLRPVARSRRA